MPSCSVAHLAHMRSTTLGSSHIEFPVHKCESYSREKHALVGFDALLRDASGLPSGSAATRSGCTSTVHYLTTPGQVMESSPALRCCCRADIPLCRGSIVTVAGRSHRRRPLHSLASTLRAITCPCFVTIPGFPLAVRKRNGASSDPGCQVVTQERTGLLF
jgi:hypothetical protein